MMTDRFLCPVCGYAMTPQAGPNYTEIRNERGETVVVLSCLRSTCRAVLGTYVRPATPDRLTGHP